MNTCATSRLLLSGLLLLAAGTCHAGAEFSINRDFKRGGERESQSIALVCSKDEPELGECKVFRASDGVAEKTVKVDAGVAREIFLVAGRRLKGTSRDAPTSKANSSNAKRGSVGVPASNSTLRWTLTHQGRSVEGRSGPNIAGSLAPLMSIEQRLFRELDR